MGLYERYVWAPLVEYPMRQPPVMDARRKVVPRATGRVLEIGVGTGLNLGLYDSDRIERVDAFDPSREMLRRARGRASPRGVTVGLFAGSAEDMPFEDATFDTVVTTFTLCSIPRVTRALQEMRRVLKPVGRLLFAEHGLSRDTSVARWQRRLNPAWRLLSGGCNMDRAIVPLIEAAGFRIGSVEVEYLPGPRVLTYCSTGVAMPGT